MLEKKGSRRISDYFKNADIVILPLGGCGEIGINFTLLKVENFFYFIDCGSLFPDDSMPGVDLIIPQMEMDFEFKLNAWIITHGHEDHIGALPHFFKKMKAPIYAPPFAAELIRAKFSEHGIQDFQILEFQENITKTIFNLKVTPSVVNHSIPHTFSLVIDTKFGAVVHTADWRIDNLAPEKTRTDANLKKVTESKKILFMLSDSTNAMVPGKDDSESDVKDTFEKIFTEKKQGAIYVSLFSSHIWRINSILSASRKTGKKVFFYGRSLKRNVEIAKKLGLLGDLEKVVIWDEKELDFLPRSNLCVVCTGSQGEEYSALNRLSFGAGFQAINLASEDTVILSARAIPGNERSIYAMWNRIAKMGIELISGHDECVHVSGHGYQEDLKTLIDVVRPRYFIPVHGEFRHLTAHKGLALEVGMNEENCFVIENGTGVQWKEKTDKVQLFKVKSGRTYVFSEGFLDHTGATVKERKKLGDRGFLNIFWIRSENKIYGKFFGLPVEDAELDKLCQHSVEKIDAGLSNEKATQILHTEVKRRIEKKYNYNPVIFIRIV